MINVSGCWLGLRIIELISRADQENASHASHSVNSNVRHSRSEAGEPNHSHTVSD